MSKAVALLVHSSTHESRVVELRKDGNRVPISSWSIESDWLYVVFNGQRQAYRLYPHETWIEETHLPEKSRIIS